jgi:membrane protein involved in colicin uptake
MDKEEGTRHLDSEVLRASEGQRQKEEGTRHLDSEVLRASEGQRQKAEDRTQNGQGRMDKALRLRGFERF